MNTGGNASCWIRTTFQGISYLLSQAGILFIFYVKADCGYFGADRHPRIDSCSLRRLVCVYWACNIVMASAVLITSAATIFTVIYVHMRHYKALKIKDAAKILVKSSQPGLVHLKHECRAVFRWLTRYHRRLVFVRIGLFSRVQWSICERLFLIETCDRNSSRRCLHTEPISRRWSVREFIYTDLCWTRRRLGDGCIDKRDMLKCKVICVRKRNH